ncbi:MAG: hypothetical protein HY858_11570 [Candidatus Solibacter usitatus]|nr:hypothetical protein [Candidatus Solibacter usitatus]
MRSSISLAAAVLSMAPALASWPRVLESAGLDASGLVILEGDSAQARAVGFIPTPGLIPVRNVIDSANPGMQIIWEHEQRLPRFETPAQATVFTRERWTGAPLAAGFRRDGKVVFWTAVSPGERGYERFPYLVQALAELGVTAQVETRGLWAFFDSSYRLRADQDYLARRWRRGGISALHIAAWHYWEPDQARDAWLGKLIEACHRHAIAVYAWVELPHVSNRFWETHPEWREKTATGQDAQLDWRRLMNLSNEECAAEVERDLRGLSARFDWDGINLGELYFESLEGYLNPARFTPFSPEVRREFSSLHGFDPAEMYHGMSPRWHLRDAASMRLFLDYRAGLAARLQQEWLGRLEAIRRDRPWLDLTLTHVDDRFDTTMRDRLGADAGRLLPAAAQAGATFLIEDPATLWHLGADRYAELARRYAAIAPPRSSLAIDINVVERYQDVYPTKQQTGVELFQLLHQAASSFPRVAIYFENSILAPDWPLIAAAAAPARILRLSGGEVEVYSPDSAALRWPGCAEVDGEAWPIRSAGRLLVPAGRHVVSPCSAEPKIKLTDFNGTLLAARAVGERLEIAYESRSRAIALLADGRVVLLPPGRRTVTFD